jgi:hypothetical protein
MNKNLKTYQNDGFKGFVKVSELQLSCNQVPRVGGIYVVLRTSETEPKFLKHGTGGYFKEKDPNVSISKLEDKFISGSITMYIGKGDDLHERICKLLKFGNGHKIGHWGGRYLWQLSDAQDLLIAWKETPNGNPESIEKKMLEEYRKEYGKLPFANLRV